VYLVRFLPRCATVVAKDRAEPSIETCFQLSPSRARHSAIQRATGPVVAENIP
jgi:hypothetical protein